jgi:hypothetical protein
LLLNSISRKSRRQLLSRELISHSGGTAFSAALAITQRRQQQQQQQQQLCLESGSSRKSRRQ